MLKGFRIWTTTAALIAALGMANLASAGPIQISAWNGNPIQSGDKLYTYESSSGIPLGGANPAMVDTFNNGTIYQIEFSELEHVVGPWTGSLLYNVEILGPHHFWTARLDSDVNATDVDVEKWIYSDANRTNLVAHLESVNGDPQTVDICDLGLKHLWLTIDIDVSNTGVLANVSDTYTQCPEPSSMAFLGCLAGFGLVARFKRRKDK
ncbi:MAG: hypothetical protein ACKV0T_20465 [Planctomycetales bacterium]